MITGEDLHFEIYLPYIILAFLEPIEDFTTDLSPYSKYFPLALPSTIYNCYSTRALATPLNQSQMLASIRQMGCPSAINFDQVNLANQILL